MIFSVHNRHSEWWRFCSLCKCSKLLQIVNIKSKQLLQWQNP